MKTRIEIEKVSFLLIGRKIKKTDIPSHDRVVLFGGNFEGGDILFELTPSDREFFQQLQLPENYIFYSVFLFTAVSTPITSKFLTDIKIFFKEANESDILFGIRNKNSGKDSILRSIEYSEKRKIEEKFKLLKENK